MFAHLGIGAIGKDPARRFHCNLLCHVLERIYLVVEGFSIFGYSWIAESEEGFEGVRAHSRVFATAATKRKRRSKRAWFAARANAKRKTQRQEV
jgi:hypothetical protein